MTGGNVCSVAECKSNSKSSKKQGTFLFFFSFPKNPKIRREWIKKCDRKDKWNAINKRICSKHFKPEDFEDELQARLLNLKPKKLKKDAVPSLFLHSTEEKHEISERSERMLQIERKKIVDALLQSSPAPPTKLEIFKNNNINIDHTSSSCEKEIEYVTLKLKFEALQKENIKLKKKKLDILNNVTMLKQHVHKIEQQLRNEKNGFENKVKDAFKDVLTSNQIEIVLGKKSKARWTTEEFYRAFTLRYFSTKHSYNYLKETLHYPLPGLSTLHRWIAKMNSRSGILDDVLNIMNTTGQIKNNVSKVTVLSFGKIKLSSLYKDDKIMGPQSYMQVIMARGLFDNWKQLVYVCFNEKLTKELLESLIIRLHEIDYNVVACTSDCGSGNQELWKEIGITMDNTFTEHPLTKKPIYFFADVPQLLRLLRNWFLDTGFILSSGMKIDKEPVESLIEMNSCLGLTSLHLNRKTTKKQKMRLATELFSNTTATALKHYLPGDDDNAAKETGDFFQLVNNWFDVMNSYTLVISVPTKKPYGMDLDVQNEVLDEMSSVVKGMLCAGKKFLKVFQKGIVISIASLKSLYTNMKQDYDIEFILTHRLNQECVDDLFSQIRTKVRPHDYPSPLNAVYRIRMMLLGRNPELAETHSNVVTFPELQHDNSLLERALTLSNIETTEPELQVPVDQSKKRKITETKSRKSFKKFKKENY